MPKVLKKISIIWVLIAVFILKEAMWVAIIPPRDAPDELGHYGYVESLFYERGLPLLGETKYSQRTQVAGAGEVFSAGVEVNAYRPGNQLNWIAQHPPFYYLLLLPFFSVLPHYDVMFSIFILRFFSVLLGAVTLYFSWKTLEKLGMDSTGGASRNNAALFNAAVIGAIAFLPMFSYISAVLNNDNLLGAFSAILIYMLIDYCDNGASYGRMVVLGIVMGILALTKATALPLFGVAAAAFVMRFLVVFKKRVFFEALTAFGVALLFAGWWYARNYHFFGVFVPELKDAIAGHPSLLEQNPSLITLFPELGGAAKGAFSFWEFLFNRGFIVEYFKNIWGAFGRFFTQLNQWQYFAATLFTLIGACGWGFGIKIKRDRPRVGHVMGKIILGLVLAVYFSAITIAIYRISSERGYLSAMHGRYFLPALLPFFYFIVRGWERIVPKKAQPLLFTLMIGFFIANDIAALLYVVIPALY